jgi:hypothetical protein
MAKVTVNSGRTATKLSKLLKNKKEGPYNVAVQLKQKIDEFKGVMPFVTKLRHPGIRTRHWEMIAKDVGFKRKSLV